ncbi:MAG TPA: MFS transporter [Anaeromyxobacteraceae bacterium]|nr:MFS transporter [Anaeromyxobacteraceae bacterium]
MGHPRRDPAPPPATRLLAGLLATAALTGTAGGALQLGVPLLALSLGAGSAEVALVRSISGAGMLLLVLPVGFLVDRFGSRRVYAIGAVAGAALAAAYGAGPSLPIVIALMGLEGVCAPLRFTSLTAAFYGRLSALGVGKAGWFKGSMSFGLTFLGPLIGGLLASDAGFASLFAVVAGLHLCSAALGSLCDLDGDRPRGAAPPPRPGEQAAELLRLLRTPPIRPALAAEFLGAATFASFSAFMVVIVVRVYGADATVASRILIVEGLSFILTAFACGRFGRHPRALLAAAGFAGAAGTVGTLAAVGPVSLALAGVGIGLASGLLHIYVASWIAGLREAGGKVSSIFQVAAGLGVTLGPLAAALAGRHLPPQAVLVIFAPLFLLLAGTVLWRPSPEPAVERDALAPAEPSPTT